MHCLHGFAHSLAFFTLYYCFTVCTLLCFLHITLLYLCTFVCFFCVCEFYRFESSDQRSLSDTAYHVRATLNPSYWRNCAMNSYQHHTSPLASHATVAISTEYHRHRAMRAVCPTPVSDSIAHFARETPVGSRGRAGVYGPFCTLHHDATPFAIRASDPTAHPKPLTYPTHSPDCQRPPPPTQRARDVKLLFKDVS